MVLVASNREKSLEAQLEVDSGDNEVSLDSSRSSMASAGDLERGPRPTEGVGGAGVAGLAQGLSASTSSVPGADEADPAYTIPDGGLEAWLQVLGSWVVLVDTWGLVNSFGVYQTYYETTLLPTSSPSAISWIGSLQASLLMLVGVVSGPLYDAGHFRALLACGLLLIVLGQFMTSLCTAYWQVLLAQGVAMGVGMGLTFLPSAAILAQYFRRRRALVLGISSTGSPIAGIVFPVLFARLEPALGFGWANRIIAFVLLGISVIPLVCMHTRVLPSSSPLPSNSSSPPSPTTGVGGTAGSLGASLEKTTPGWTRVRRRLFDATALRDGAFISIVLGSFFSFLVLYVPFFYIQLYAETHGIADPGLSPYVVTVLNAGSIVGRVLPNYVADRAGSVNVVIACGVGSAALLLGWIGILVQGAGFGSLVAFAVLYGLFSGGIVSVTPSVIISLSPDMGRVGARMGMTFSLTGLAILVGTPAAGAVVAGYGRAQWLGMMGYSAGGLLLGTAFYFCSRLLLYRRARGWRG